MDAPHHGVIVTLPEIYQDVQETKRTLTEMNTKLDRFISLNQRLDSHKEDIEEHDDRLRKLEIQISAQWVIVGLMVTGVGAMVARVFTGG